MGYGFLDSQQRQVVSLCVKGEDVLDVGAGDLNLTKELVKLGANTVVALDKEFPRGLKYSSKISLVQAYFYVYTKPSKVSFVSWPVNRETKGLLEILETSEVVVYLGKNTDGVACGSTSMWDHLLCREVLHHCPSRENTLIVYGPQRVPKREMLPEEFAFRTPQIWYYGQPIPSVHG